MSKIIVIVGFGPGISTSVAEKFGTEGFSVALIVRNEARLISGVEALKNKRDRGGNFRLTQGTLRLSPRLLTRCVQNSDPSLSSTGMPSAATSRI